MQKRVPSVCCYSLLYRLSMVLLCRYFFIFVGLRFICVCPAVAFRIAAIYILAYLIYIFCWLLLSVFVVVVVIVVATATVTATATTAVNTKALWMGNISDVKVFQMTLIRYQILLFILYIIYTSIHIDMSVCVCRSLPSRCNMQIVQQCHVVIYQMHSNLS